jgi:hypothetical protein
MKRKAGGETMKQSRKASERRKQSAKGAKGGKKLAKKAAKPLTKADSTPQPPIGRVFRITNVRANAASFSGGSAVGATPVIAALSAAPTKPAKTTPQAKTKKQS